MARSLPCRAPRNTAPGRARRRAGPAGPSPTMTSRTPGSPATSARAGRPASPGPAARRTPRAARRRGRAHAAAAGCAGPGRTARCPPPGPTATPAARRARAGSRRWPRTGRGCGRRRCGCGAATATRRPRPARPSPVDPGVGGHVGLVDGHRGQAFPAGGGDGGRAEDKRAREVDQFGAVADQRGVQLPDRQADPEAAVTRQRHGGQPHHRPRERAGLPAAGAFRAGAGAMTIGWCPRKTRCSATRSAQCATPFTSGGKDSATIATRTLTT